MRWRRMQGNFCLLQLIPLAIALHTTKSWGAVWGFCCIKVLLSRCTWTLLAPTLPSLWFRPGVGIQSQTSITNRRYREPTPGTAPTRTFLSVSKSQQNKWYRTNLSWSSKGTVRQCFTWVWFCTIAVYTNQAWQLHQCKVTVIGLKQSLKTKGNYLDTHK